MLDDTPADSTTSEDVTAAPPETPPGVDGTDGTDSTPAPAAKKTTKRTTAKKSTAKKAPATKAAAKKTPAKRTSKKTAAAAGTDPADAPDAAAELAAADQPLPVEDSVVPEAVDTDEAVGVVETAQPATKKAAAKRTTKKTAAKRTTKKATAKKAAPSADTDAGQAAAVTPDAGADADQAPAAADPTAEAAQAPDSDAGSAATVAADETPTPAPVSAVAPLFQPPDPSKATAAPRRRTRKSAAAPAADVAGDEATTQGPAGAERAVEDRARDDAEQQTQPDSGRGDSDARESDQGESDQGESGQDGDRDRGEGQDDEQSGGGRRRRRRGGRRRRKGNGDGGGGQSDATDDSEGSEASDDTEDRSESGSQGDAGGQGGQGGQGGRGQRGGQRSGKKSGKGDAGGKQADAASEGEEQGATRSEAADADGDDEGSSSRRRRRRRRSSDDSDGSGDDPNTVTRVRKPRNPEDEITALSGSTRLEAKKQRRREGREAGRRRAPIVSEAEFLARREAVDRTMVIRQRKDLTQIAVLEDKVLVEHYVARESQTSLIGNVYLGKVQNVLPSMEAAFIDIGKGRNAVLYAGEVNWDALGAGNGPRKIEAVLKSGQPVLVQVTKDPIGHKGARLTSQVSLPGRFLVYVPDGTTSGISRKLPDTERTRLKTLLKEIVPDSAGVIVRTAAEGASEDELTLDVERLTARWADIERKIEKGNAPQLLYGEPDLTLKVVRDLFTEDFKELVVSGDDAWEMVSGYVGQVAPELEDRLERYDGERDVFAAYRIDEQIDKALDRKVWLPSGGSLIIDRTEAMTVVDVNTGKFTGSGGNLEETVTKNNLEAAEEMVRQLRLRDIGGIIVIDFIDMVLESNRDLVLRRLVECLGRDRTRHQVAEVTSLGLVQMTRKRIGTGLLEAFSEDCEHCEGRGLITHHEPIDPRRKQDDEPRRGRRGRTRGDDAGDRAGDRSGDAASGNGRGGNGGGNGKGGGPAVAPSPKEFAAMAKHEPKPSGNGDGDASPAPAVEQPAAAADSATVTEPAAPAGRDQEPVRAEPQAEPEPAAQPESAARPEPAAERAAEPRDAAGSVGGTDAVAEDGPAGEPDGAPTVRTTTRSRGRSRRPAGPPSQVTSEPVVVVAEPEAPVEPVAAADPGDGSLATADEGGATPIEAPAPVVVTSSRRRGARRPAGPPVEDGEA
jgi:ribonuclease E